MEGNGESEHLVMKRTKKGAVNFLVTQIKYLTQKRQENNIQEDYN